MSSGCRGSARSLGVALLTLVAAGFALALADDSSGGPLMTALGAAVALPFLARGALGYTAAWQARTPETALSQL